MGYYKYLKYSLFSKLVLQFSPFGCLLMFFEGEIKNVLQVGLDEFYVGKYLYTTVE